MFETCCVCFWWTFQLCLEQLLCKANPTVPSYLSALWLLVPLMLGYYKPTYQSLEGWWSAVAHPGTGFVESSLPTFGAWPVRLLWNQHFGSQHRMLMPHSIHIGLSHSHHWYLKMHIQNALIKLIFCKWMSKKMSKLIFCKWIVELDPASTDVCKVVLLDSIYFFIGEDNVGWSHKNNYKI